MLDVKIFNRKRINFKPKYDIRWVSVQNNIVLILLKSANLIKVDLKYPEKHEEINLLNIVGTSTDIYKIFQDYSSCFIIISTISGNNFFLSSSSKPYMLNKIKGNVINYISWNKKIYNQETGPILFGTISGLLYELKLSFKNNTREIDTSTKFLLNFSKDMETQITGIEFFELADDNISNYYIIITTYDRLYQYFHTLTHQGISEYPILFKIFFKYENQMEKFYELPGNFPQTKIAFSYSDNFIPQRFAWLSGSGIFLGMIDYSFKVKEDSFIRETQLIPYPSKVASSSFIDAIMTQFHLIILYPDRCIAINIMNNQIVFEDKFPKEYGICMGMCQDLFEFYNSDHAIKKLYNEGFDLKRRSYIIDNIWVYCEKAIFRYRIIQEDRDVWKYYMAQYKFTLARTYCKNSIDLEAVNLSEAHHLFNKEGNFDRAAELFSSANISLQDVALLYYQMATNANNLEKIYRNQNNRNLHDSRLDEKTSSFSDKIMKGFIRYLQLVLESKIKKKEKMVIVVIWICELYLTRMDNYRMNQIFFNAILNEFKDFISLPKLKDCLYENRNKIFDLVSNHNNEKAYISFAQNNQDFKKMVEYHMERSSYETILQILIEKKNLDLFYQFSPLLIEKIPNELLNSWRDMFLKHKVWLNSINLLPAIIKLLTSNSLNTGELNERYYAMLIINYLEYVIESCNSYIFSNDTTKRLNIKNSLIINYQTRDEINSSNNPFDVSDQSDIEDQNDTINTSSKSYIECGRNSSWISLKKERNINKRQHLSNEFESLNFTSTYSRPNDEQHFSSSFNNMPNKIMVNSEIHDLLISLYCQYQPDKVLIYFKKYAKDIDSIQFTINIILKLCFEYNNLRASVYLLTLLKNYERALELSLQFDIELAKQTARLQPNKNAFGISFPDKMKQNLNNSLRKKLWLIIAKHELINCYANDFLIKGKCAELLRESNCLIIQDLLPYFPDFQTIDHFKEPVMSCLKNYHENLNSFKNETNDLDCKRNELRFNIDSYHNKTLLLKPNDVCCICKKFLFDFNKQHANVGGKDNPAFYCFPGCNHFFHCKCLRLESDEEYYDKECLYCGERFISSIEDPYVDIESYDEEYKNWF